MGLFSVITLKETNLNLCVLEDERISFIIPYQELEMKIDRFLSREDTGEFPNPSF